LTAPHKGLRVNWEINLPFLFFVLMH